MDEFERAKRRTERMQAIGRWKAPESPPPVHERKEEVPEQKKPVLLQPKPRHDRGKVRIEVRVYLKDEPLTFLYSTEMRTHLLPSQMNHGWLAQRFKDLFKEFGRVNDLPPSGQ